MTDMVRIAEIDHRPIASPSDAERHERAVPDGWQLVPKVATMEMVAAGSNWSGLPAQTWTDMIDAAPPPPVAVQDPVALKVLEWVEASSGYWKAYSVGGRYSTYRVSHALGFDLRRDGESIGEYHLSLEAAKAAAQADYEQRIRSALSTSQSDPAKTEADG
ncbi:hypothetical protein [Rhizobium sp. SG741]|uniref:hypothetical protein n=1 Tax=Rhizobium sp. SG741 TaxID=2587114 RepID=UPI00144700C1|nr:hypothetical protein [Rhizobium sp. SG741]NKJ03092.1 hypothetical protein [Rhizobium sp. SG741]